MPEHKQSKPLPLTSAQDVGFKGWLRNLFSIDEKRTSTLILLLFVVIGLNVFVKNLADIKQGWLTIINMLIGAIGAVNTFGNGIYNPTYNYIQSPYGNQSYGYTQGYSFQQQTDVNTQSANNINNNLEP
jgi:hypothetical protein